MLFAFIEPTLIFRPGQNAIVVAPPAVVQERSTNREAIQQIERMDRDNICDIAYVIGIPVRSSQKHGKRTGSIPLVWQPPTEARPLYAK